MARHPSTIHAEIAFNQATKALQAAQEAKSAADEALLKAEQSLRAAQQELEINRDLDSRGPGYDQGASRMKA